MYSIYLNFSSDQDYVRPNRVKKYKKEHFLPFFNFLTVWFAWENYSKMINSSVKWPRMSDVPTDLPQLNIHWVGQSMDFGDFSEQKFFVSPLNDLRTFRTSQCLEIFLFWQSILVPSLVQIQRGVPKENVQKNIYWLVSKHFSRY